jgi:hypothetical protein
MNTNLLKHSMKAFFLTLLMVVSTLPMFAQDCNCNYTVKSGEWLVDGAAAKIGPGSVVCIPAGVRGALTLKNFVGSATNPIIIKNCGGKATFKNSSSSSYGLKIQNSKYFKLTGTGTPSIEHGIEIDGPHVGLTLESLSTNFEVDHIKVMNTGAMGISAKTDPTCDQATWKGNFTMRDVVFHDNLVERTGSEAFYIGSSHYTTGVTKTCNGSSVRLWEHSLENVKVYKNVTRVTGRDGIQVGGAIRNTEIYDNVVENYGTKQLDGHMSGIQINPGTVAKTYNNLIKNGNGPGYGIFVTGDGGNVVYNNIIINSKNGGIFCDDRGTTPGTKFAFINNTIINAGLNGIRMYSRETKGNILSNNIIVGVSSNYIDKRSGVDLIESNNLFTQDINSVKFANVGNQDYRLLEGSPAIDKGMNTSALGVITDFGRLRRPSGVAYDIGSYEFQAVSTVTPITVSAGANQAITLPVNSVTLKGTASGGTITSYAWTKVSGPTATLSNATTANLSVSNMLAGTYVFRLTAKNSSNATASSDITVTVNPAEASTTTEGVTSLTLINASTQKEIKKMTNGEVISFGSLGTNKLSIRAITEGTIGSVVFILDGKTLNTENLAPYSIASDRETSTGSTFYNAWTPTLGNHTLVVKSFSGVDGTGTEKASVTVSFSVVTKPSASSLLDGDSVSTEKGASSREKVVASSLINEEAMASIVAYPNPFVDHITVDFHDVSSNDVTITIIDQLGRLVYENKQSVAPGSSKIEINLSPANMTPGIYVMKINSKNIKNKTIKLIKQ